MPAEGDEELMATSHSVAVRGEAVGDRYKPSMLRHRVPNKLELDEPGEAEGDRYKPGMLQLGSPNKVELDELGVAAGDRYKPSVLRHGTPAIAGGRAAPLTNGEAQKRSDAVAL